MRPQAIILEGRHVRLEPLAVSHVEELFAIAAHAELWDWTTSRIRSPDEMRWYIDEALELQARGLALPFLTRHRATGRAVGSTRFGNIDRANRRVEIGWTWVAPAWQRTPVNTEAKYLMLRHAFEAWDCIRVEFKTDVLNEKSRRALLRIGATEEGVLRSHMITESGRIRDTVYFSILPAEWPRVKADLEHMLDRPFAAASRDRTDGEPGE